MNYQRLRILCIGLVLSMSFFSLHTTAQNGSVVPTMGKEFWMGFMSNYQPAMQLNLYISSNVNTSGTVSVPTTGWSIPFVVTANVTTTVAIPTVNEHQGSEVISNKGILIESLDTIAVFALNFHDFSSDAAMILPTQSLGTEYIVHGCYGLDFFGTPYKSEMLIVATEDNTEVEITPSVTTLGGNAAGVPFLVQLQRGESYQIQSTGGLATQDLTGTTVEGTSQSGSCRPFAIFSGSECSYVPASCSACDHLFEQNYPTATWGQNYFTVPFAGTTSYTYRVLAKNNGTSVTVNGGVPFILNSGQFTEVNAEANALCIQGSAPISVMQIMEGASCVGSGDPAILMLNSEEEKISDITFSTVFSTVITNHDLNIVVESAFVNQVTLDGVPVPPASFTPYPICPSHSWAQVSLTAGSHTLFAPPGLTAYAYGTGGYETYAYSVGSFSPLPPIVVDTVLCGLDSTGSLTLSPPNPLFNPFWTTASNPTDTLYFGTPYTFVPTSSDIYIVTGNELVSGCEDQYFFSVEIDDPPLLTMNPATTVCAYEPVQLSVTPNPSGTYVYNWWPDPELNDGSLQNPIATPSQTTWYYVSVSTFSGCAVAVDSVLITVLAGDVLSMEAQTQKDVLCIGDSSQLNVEVHQIIESDNFDTGTGAMWTTVQGGAPSQNCGSINGDALYFNGAAPRAATSVSMDVSAGGTIHFALKIANGLAPCENADPGENVLLEYSTNGGGIWTTISTYNEALFPNFIVVDVPIPAGAMTPNTMFRWIQPVFTAAGEDNWALEDVAIGVNDYTDLSFSWTPVATLSDPAIPDPMSYPIASGWYYVDVTDLITTCVYTDSIFIDVGQPFSIGITPDTTICDVAGIQLQAVPSSGANHTWSWTPNNGTLSANNVQNPIATPTTTTTYYVTVVTGFGCEATDSVTITVNQVLSLTAGSSNNGLCEGDSTFLTAVIPGNPPGLVYSWSPQGSVIDPNSQNTWAFPYVTTNYIITVTDTLAGCSLVDSVLVDVTNLYSTTVTPDTTVCSAIGLQLNVNHNVPNAIINWTPSSLLIGANTSTPTINFDSTMTYIVQVTDQFACSTFDTVTVTVAFSDLTFVPDSSLCQGDSMVIDAGYPGSTYLWNTSETTQLITVNSAGSYSVTITDADGCQTSFTTNVTVDPLPVVNIGPDSSLCIGQSWLLDAGNPGSTYLWSNAAVTQSINVSTDNNYSVTVTDANDCSSTDTALITFDPLPVVLFTDTTVCISESITLDAGNAGSSYLWNTNETTQSITVDSVSGTYSVIVTTPTVCTDSADVSLTFVGFPVVDLGPDSALCDGQSITLDATNPASIYTWSTGQNSPTITLTASELVDVTVFNGYCSSFDTVDIVFNPLPLELVQAVMTTCLEFYPNYVPVDAGNTGSTFSWSNGDTTQITLADEYGMLYVTITTPLNCSITDAVQIIEFCPGALYVPNSFTPDGDGINDLFLPLGNNLAAVDLMIFDRWGELIHRTEDLYGGWDGRTKGTAVQDGVYVWKLVYRFYQDAFGTIGIEQEKTGHVTVIR